MPHTRQRVISMPCKLGIPIISTIDVLVVTRHCPQRYVPQMNVHTGVDTELTHPAMLIVWLESGEIAFQHQYFMPRCAHAQLSLITSLVTHHCTYHCYNYSNSSNALSQLHTSLHWSLITALVSVTTTLTHLHWSLLLLSLITSLVTHHCTDHCYNYSNSSNALVTTPAITHHCTDHLACIVAHHLLQVTDHLSLIS